MQASNRSYTIEEYRVLDEAAPEGVRLEYFDGTIYVNGQPFDPDWGWDQARSMSGASLRHNRIIMRIGRKLDEQLTSSGCYSLATGQRVQVHYQKHSYTYPDVVVYCGEPEFADHDERTLQNPTILVEVLSDSTKDNDRGWKLEAYTRIKSLKEYWIVEQEQPGVTRFIRKGDLWKLDFQHDPDTVLEGEGYSIVLGSLYRD